MDATRKTFLPAAGHDLFLPLYDPLVKLMGGDSARRTLIKQADIRSGQRVLDIGCGTGTLAVQIIRIHPDVEVIGLDPDPRALARAKRKAKRASVSIRFDEGFSNQLPYDDASIDRVLSSFMFHHLEIDDKEAMLREARRVLKPGGLFNLLDFSGPEPGSRSVLARFFHSAHRLEDNSEKHVLALIERAGFEGSGSASHRTMLFGLMGVTYFQAS